MDESVYSRLKVHKHAKRRGARDATLYGRPCPVFVCDTTPGIRLELFDGEVQLACPLFHSHDLDLHFVTDFEIFVDILHLFPGDF